MKDIEDAVIRWKALADNKQWDQVKADLAVYQYSGTVVTEDHRRKEPYKRKVLQEGPPKSDLQTVLEALEAQGFSPGSLPKGEVF